MQPIINLTANRNFKIRNFEEDKISTLNYFKGLRYIGKKEGFERFKGNYFLINSSDELIESFEILILVGNKYPHVIPLVIPLDDKVEKSEDYHINNYGSGKLCTICFEHSYIENYLVKKEVRLYDFLFNYLPKYFSWVLVKKYGNSSKLKEWDHQELGVIEIYQSLLETKDKNTIRDFLHKFCNQKKIRRNKNCYCGSLVKLKHCHYKAIKFLSNTPKTTIQKDIKLFR